MYMYFLLHPLSFPSPLFNALPVLHLSIPTHLFSLLTQYHSLSNQKDDLIFCLHPFLSLSMCLSFLSFGFAFFSLSYIIHFLLFLLFLFNIIIQVSQSESITNSISEGPGIDHRYHSLDTR